MDDAVLTHPSRPARPVTPSTILADRLAELRRDLDAHPSLAEDVRARMHHVHELACGVEPYLSHCTSPESPALAELARRTREVDWDDSSLEQEMLSGHVEGRLLNFLVSMSGARRVLEIGMFTGYSALAMAEALPAGGTVVACELDATAAALARACFDALPVGDRIVIELGPAMDTLRRLHARTDQFDFVFVDADKGGYSGYVDFLLSSTLLAPRAVIAVDNTLMQGEPYLGGPDTSPNGTAIAAFNEAVRTDPRVEQVMVPVRDGLTLIRRVMT